MGNCCSLLCEPRTIENNITVNVKSRNENNNTVDKNKKEGKRKSRQSESDEELSVKRDQESRPRKIEEEKNHSNMKIEATPSGQESKKNNSPIPGKEGLALQPTKSYVDEIGISPYNLVESRKTYDKLGQFDYGGEKYTENLKKWKGKNKAGEQWIYIGQVKKGTELPDGIGISVWDNGSIYEGYHKDGEANGYGRYIFPSGAYYIGDFENGVFHGNGEYHYNDGKVHKGLYENGKANGHGIMTYPDGTKKTGKWKDDVFQG